MPMLSLLSLINLYGRVSFTYFVYNFPSILSTGYGLRQNELETKAYNHKVRSRLVQREKGQVRT